MDTSQLASLNAEVTCGPPSPLPEAPLQGLRGLACSSGVTSFQNGYLSSSQLSEENSVSFRDSMWYREEHDFWQGSWNSPSHKDSRVSLPSYRNGSFEIFQFLLGVLLRQVAFSFSLVNSRFQGVAVISKGQGQLYKHVLLGTRVWEKC